MVVAHELFMWIHRRPFWLICGFFLLTIAACEDPSNVGIGLIGGEGGEPNSTVLEATMTDTLHVRDVTGNSLRVLSGTVDDPLFGGVSATGYIDFQRRQADNENYKNTAFTKAQLILAHDYVYGDTLSTITLALRDMPAAWTSNLAPSDTVIEASPGTIVTFSFPANQDEIAVDLPDAWLDAHNDLLRSDSFSTGFHGFRLDPVSGNAVVGFSAGQSMLRAYTAQDTVDFASQRTTTTVTPQTITGLQRIAPPTLPPDRIVLQDGVGPALSFNFDFSILQNVVLNGALIRFHADTLSVQQNTPANFYRPPFGAVQLRGITSAGKEATLAATNLDSQGRLGFSSTALAASLRAMLLGEDLYDHYKLLVSTDVINSINAVLLVDRGATTDAPTAVLVTTPASP